MNNAEYYEKHPLCCNPFGIKGHKSTRTNLRQINESNRDILHRKGIVWASKKMRLCTTCRIKISKIDRQEMSTSALPEELFEQFSPVPSSVSTNAASSADSIQPMINMEAIDGLANFLGIEINKKQSRLDPSTSNYRISSLSEIHSRILNTINSWFPHEVVKSPTDDFDEILFNLKSAFSIASDTKSKIEVLKLLPRYWSYSKIESIFDGATKHMIKESKANVLGIETLSKAGRPLIIAEVHKKIENFYLTDDISRPFPGLKDTVSVKLPNGTRQNIQKRLLLAPLSELHQQYLNLCKTDEEKISFTTFWKNKPKQCVYTRDSSAMNVCVCMIHENTKLLLDALKKTACFDHLNSEKDLKTLLLNKITCPESTEACFLRSCDFCSSKNMIDFVGGYLDQHNIDQIKYCFWVTSPRCEIISKEDDTSNFLDILETQLEKFVVHQFKVGQQIQFIRMKKEGLVPTKEVMCQLDFAENYSCIIQDAIQSHYFGRPQVTIHPFVVFYNDGSTIKVSNFIVIADIKKHNTVSVYAFQKKLINKLKEKFPDLEKIIYLSDGCAEQYKNKTNFKNLCCHQQDFNISAEWHFFPTSHGKGPCDGIGGNIKRMARDASMRKTADINNAKQFFDWATSEKAKQQFKKDWEFIFASNDDYEEAENFLQHRFRNLLTIPGTKKYHEFIPKDQSNIYASEYSSIKSDHGNSTCFSLENTKKRKASSNGNRRQSSRTKKDVNYSE